MGCRCDNRDSPVRRSESAQSVLDVYSANCFDENSNPTLAIHGDGDADQNPVNVYYGPKLSFPAVRVNYLTVTSLK